MRGGWDSTHAGAESRKQKAEGRRQEAGGRRHVFWLLAREIRALFATNPEDPFQDHSKMAKQLHSLFPFALVMSGALAFAQSNAPALPNTGQDLTPLGTFVPLNPRIEDQPEWTATHAVSSVVNPTGN